MNEALEKWKLNRINEKNKSIVERLRDSLSSCALLDQELLQLFNTSVSIFQSEKCKGGKGFESIIENQLRINDIPFVPQVAIDKNGIIIGTGTTIENHAHTLDILVGANSVDSIKGKYIKDYIVISCKTTVRERWNQDEWTFEHKPKLYILCTLSSDYPNSEKFRESPSRKIATDNPRKRDERKYKLQLEDILDEIISNLYPLCSTSSPSLQNYERGHNPMLAEKLLDDAQFSTQQDLCYTQFEESSMESL
jgi:hypothetical protein